MSRDVCCCEGESVNVDKIMVMVIVRNAMEEVRETAPLPSIDVTMDRWRRRSYCMAISR